MEHIERYGRAARWVHVVVYVSVAVATATGWWFVVDRYEHPLFGLPDKTLHEFSGLLLLVVLVVYVLVRLRAAIAFVRESASYERADLGWLKRWPRAIFSGRFQPHEGRYDPGQRIANLAMLGALLALGITGMVMLYVDLPLSYVVVVVGVHRWTTYLLTPLIMGHIIVASGVLPGYRGVWRSMHLGGRLRVDVSRRIWPGWTERKDRERL